MAIRSKITTLRPKDYSEYCTIGERFRDSSPLVIMDLVLMDNRCQAAGRFRGRPGLRAARPVRQAVATKVFLLARRRR